MYPLNRCKILHLVRHAEGIHNVEGANKSKTSPELLDACLSQLGWEQVENLRKHVHSSGVLQRIELVIVSPLLRTLQTADGVFGGDKMNKRVENGNHTEDSSPPFLAHELCRERMGVNTCDKRRSINEYKTQFPAVDFSLIESDEDILWSPDARETDEELSSRGIKFLKWLWSRKETEIAIVTHSAFLFQTLLAVFEEEDCDPSMKAEICTFFTNCELRSVVVVNKGNELLEPKPAADKKQESTDTNCVRDGLVKE